MEFTKERIEELKKKHGRIFLFECNGKSCLLKLANRNDLSYATITATIVSKDTQEPSFDPSKFNEAILLSCWLDGDEEIKTKDEYLLGICEKLEVLIQKSTFVVKEL